MLALLGLGIAFTAIVLSQSLEGGNLLTLLNMPAFIIVIGGTMGAVLLETPKTNWQQLRQLLRNNFKAPVPELEQAFNTVLEYSILARKTGILALEQFVPEQEPLISKAMQLLVDGKDAAELNSMMTSDIEIMYAKKLRAAKILQSMGAYAPTLGIVGAVLGLIQVMDNLADPSQLGPGIAAAFVATIYGVGFANLIFIPLANKLKAQIEQQRCYYLLFVEGLAAIADGDNTSTIRAKLEQIIA